MYHGCWFKLYTLLLMLWFVSAQHAPLPVPANHSQTRPGIFRCCLPLLPLPGWGLFPVSWHNTDIGLLHLVLVMWIMNLVWKRHGLMKPLPYGYSIKEDFYGRQSLINMLTTCHLVWGRSNFSGFLDIKLEHQKLLTLLLHCSSVLYNRTGTGHSTNAMYALYFWTPII